MAIKFVDKSKGVGWLKKQWPWWAAGMLTGLAEVINFLFLPLGHPKHKFVGVTSGMARMLAGVETRLFGGSLVATRSDYQPDIQWIIIGAFLFALVFAWLEGETRNWVKYPKGTLIFTALGAFLFAWGTRVAGGCTLHHLLGGWSAFNLKSLVVILSATVGALIAFKVLKKYDLTQYFKSQDTKWFVQQAKEYGWADGLTLKEEGKKGVLSIILYAIFILVLVLSLYNALAGNDYAVRMGWAETLEKAKIYKHMLTAAHLPDILMLILVGGLLGIAVAKTGFGTECAVITPELAREVEQDDAAAGRRWGIPFSLRTVFASYQPLMALAVHTVITGGVIWIAFTFFNVMEGHHWANEALASAFAQATGMEFHNTGISIRTMPSLTMDIFGGLLLGMGTVFMLGCEFRNYGRTGLLYITGLLIWPFFYLGYLPYTLARDFWDNLMGSSPYAPTTFVPALIAPTSKGAQVFIYFLWIAFWAFIFFWALKRGARNVGVEPSELLKLNSEGMYIARLEKIRREGGDKDIEALDKLERELAEQAAKV